MDVKITQSGRKQFSREEKLRIISECQDHGVRVTCSKYGIYPASYYYWKKTLDIKGQDGFDRNYHKATKSRFKTLEKEVETLKLMLAEEQLQSRLKDELLKKKYPELRK
jgi:putative transposase